MDQKYIDYVADVARMQVSQLDIDLRSRSMNVQAGTMPAGLAAALADAEIKRAGELDVYREKQKKLPKYRLASVGDELTLIPVPNTF